jgi:hypothetical protein
LYSAPKPISKGIRVSASICDPKEAWGRAYYARLTTG